MLGECGMKERDKRALKKTSFELCREMVVDELLIQFLQADDVLTEGMAETILAEPTSHKRSWRLLSLLPKRGPRAFESFCMALKETEQQHLCSQLIRSRDRESTPTESEGEISLTQDSTPAKNRKDQKRFPDPTLPLPTQECAVPAKRARTHESMEMCLDADSPVTTAVLPCTPEFYMSHIAQAYSMSSSPRGLALVVSNVRFEPELSELDIRRGGEVDEEVLRRLFTELDFTVSLRKDLTVQAMRDCIEQFTQRPEHAVYDCCAVCLLSHGVEGSIYGTDGQLLELDWVFERFDNARCPLLQNKPKMFFIQACRGEEMDSGVDQVDGDDRAEPTGCEQRDAGREEKSTRQNETREQRDSERLRVKLPQRSDMICGFATLKGFSTAAMRNTKKGSWFVQELNAAVRQRARDMHLSDILVQVNARIKEREGYAPGSAHHRCKEMSEFTSSLCKDLYLFPKYCPPS
ncbi:caspase-2 isoform X1 [Pygocentrus nattereri]|uniref:Caspase 2, apoptosis-related cysteine peptidase n=1 Tax=Pygocentrus nattereri TaxID=42514 RepID=A0A3B4CSF2_PYGNA|nr:caspase-2 isoform X1 [Pygocentrus nattereri]XP_017555964.1 caspase-2 isoform X1 [Pygocentrus nattereri]